MDPTFHGNYHKNKMHGPHLNLFQGVQPTQKLEPIQATMNRLIVHSVFSMPLLKKLSSIFS